MKKIVYSDISRLTKKIAEGIQNLHRKSSNNWKLDKI